MIPHDEILKNAIAKTKSRSKTETREAWREMPIWSLANGATYKIERSIASGTSKTKALDDLEDAYNYVAALYDRIRNRPSE